jgi:hypothetical protein
MLDMKQKIQYKKNKTGVIKESKACNLKTCWHKTTWGRVVCMTFLWGHTCGKQVLKEVCKDKEQASSG